MSKVDFKNSHVLHLEGFLKPDLRLFLFRTFKKISMRPKLNKKTNTNNFEVVLFKPASAEC